MPISYHRIGDLALNLGPEDCHKLFDYMVGFMSACDPNEPIGRFQDFVIKQLTEMIAEQKLKEGKNHPCANT